jgi:hypothetical protein
MSGTGGIARPGRAQDCCGARVLCLARPYSLNRNAPDSEEKSKKTALVTRRAMTR